MINWKVRKSNKNFWLVFIPALFLLAQAIMRVFGIELDLTDLQQKILEVVNALFTVLAILGIVNDPTTSGLTDSKRALTYEAPFKDEPEEE